jgi:hypothetical protein
MTTLLSTSITANQTPAIPRGRVALVALWLTQIALAAMFMLTGGLKGERVVEAELSAFRPSESIVIFLRHTDAGRY